MKRIALILSLALFLILAAGCSREPGELRPEDADEGSEVDFFDMPPGDALLNLEIINGQFRFQRIAATPCIVLSGTPLPLYQLSKGTAYEDRHDILTAFFKAMDGKDPGEDPTGCVFSRYVYMYDSQNGEVPWHYCFALCSCGKVLISNNNIPMCAIKLSAEELKSVLDVFGQETSGGESQNPPPPPEPGFFTPAGFSQFRVSTDLEESAHGIIIEGLSTDYLVFRLGDALYCYKLQEPSGMLFTFDLAKIAASGDNAQVQVEEDGSHILICRMPEKDNCCYITLDGFKTSFVNEYHEIRKPYIKSPTAYEGFSSSTGKLADLTFTRNGSSWELFKALR